MMRRIVAGTLFLTCLWLNAMSASAQDVREVQIQFEPGQLGASVDGSITGDEVVDYLLGADTNQTMTVDFDTSNSSSYFNVIVGDNREAIHIGSVAGDHFERVLSAGGEYRIRIYLMRDAARRKESAEYTLTVSFDTEPRKTLSATAPDPIENPDYADGLTGGPDFWEVTGVPQGDLLNVRLGPGTDNGIIGQIRNGDTIRNLGCEMAAGSRWCQIETVDDENFTGWVNGKFLREASSMPHDDNARNQTTGEIPCSPSAGQPTSNCTFRATRGSKGNASIWITLPSGAERYVEFAEGEPVGTDPGREISYEKLGELFLLRIDGVERYEVPEAIVFGG